MGLSPMPSRRDFVRLVAALPLAAAAGMTAGPRRAHACSCVRYGRTRVLPEPGLSDVHPRTALAFEVTGVAGLTAEARGDVRYWLESASGARVELRREQLGNLIWLTPREPLTPNTDYGLRAEITANADLFWQADEDCLTRFRTGPKRPLPALAEPRITRVRRRTPLLNSSWCAGRSYEAEFQFAPHAIAPADAGCFRWELSYWAGRAAAWTPIQGAPVRENLYRDAPMTPTASITVGRRQCHDRPVFPLHARRVTLSLVRVDGARRSITRRFR